MEKVYDVTIKNLKSFKDHEGCEIAQGEIWKGKEHLGFWSQDSWGGEDIFEFSKEKLADEVAKFKASNHFNNLLDREASADDQKTRKDIEKYFDEEMFIYEILHRMRVAKLYKKVCKKYNVTTCVAILHNTEIVMFPICGDECNSSDEKLLRISTVQEYLEKKKYGQLMVIRKEADLSIV